MNDIEKISLKFDIDKKIDLNFDNNNKLKVLMLKGDDGFNPYIISARNGKTTTVTVTDYYGTQSFDIYDGVDPTVNVIRDGNKNTLTITDVNGTRTTDIYDGVDLTGGVPTDGVIGWDNKDISYTCDGTESGDYYLTYNSVDYYFTMPTVEDGDTLLFNTVDLTLKLNGTTISTASSGTGTELTFVEYIPNGYEITEESFGGGDVIVILKTITTAPSTFVKNDKYYNSTDDLIYTATSSSAWDEGTQASTTTLYLNEADNELYRYYNNSMNLLESGGGDTIPLGATFLFPGTTAPNNYMLCDGSAISRTDYADLFAILGTSQGAGDGSTTFNLPNMKGRVPVGLDSSQTEFDNIGETGGSKAMQEHYHMGRTYSKNYNAGQTIPGGRAYARSYVPDDSVAGVWKYSGSGDVTGAEITNMVETSTAGTGNSGNLQPYLVVNYIIKVTKTTPTQAEVVNAYSTSQEDAYSCDYSNKLFLPRTISDAGNDWLKVDLGFCKVYFINKSNTNSKTYNANSWGYAFGITLPTGISYDGTKMAFSGNAKCNDNAVTFNCLISTNAVSVNYVNHYQSNITGTASYSCTIIDFS